MDRLTRSPLLLEFSLVSVQHSRPGGARKDRTHRLRQKVLKPTEQGLFQKIGRRTNERMRGTQARDDHPGLSKRRAERARQESRPAAAATLSHLQNRRGNPQAKTNRLRRRGNPQASAKTEIRESPSKLTRRPTLPKTSRFHGPSRGDLMKGRRI